MEHKGLEPPTQPLNGVGLKVLIVHARWNAWIIKELVAGVNSSLVANNVSEIVTVSVPGSWELPFAVTRLAKDYDAVIAVGVLIKGETMHFEYISESVSHGLMRAGLDSGIPVIFGVLTCLSEGQAKNRAGFEGGHNHGLDWGNAAVEMALLDKSK